MTDPNPNLDAAIMSGGPTDPQGAKPAASTPQLVEVDLNGTKVNVEASVAEALRASQAATDAAIRAAREEGAAEARRVAPASRAAPVAADDDPLADVDTALFTDPKGTIKRVVEHAVKTATTNLTAQYQAEQNRSAFWSEFYSENKDLSGEKLIVEAVFHRDMSKMMHLKVPEAAKALATAAKTELLRLKGDQGGKGGKPVAEGGNEPGNSGRAARSKSVEEPAKGPKSLSDVIRERQAARRNAATGQRQAA